jgi:copper chaperone CopZ
MKNKIILIDGMSCQHCVMELKKQLTKLDLKIIDVQIGSAKIEYDDEKVSQARLEEAVKEAGFALKN